MNRSALAIAGAMLFGCVVCPVLASGVAVQVTDQKRIASEGVSLDDAGTYVYAGSNANIDGTNPSLVPQLDRWLAASGVGAALATIPGGSSTLRNAVSDDGVWLAFLSRGNPTGGNPDGSAELFLMRTDGTETRQITSTPGSDPGRVEGYALSGSGNRLVFWSGTNPLGTNPASVVQLYAVNADGTGMLQLTSTTERSGFDASISDDGTRIAFVHRGDLTGGNADLSYELFTIQADGTGLTRLTSSANFYSGPERPRLSGDGSRIAFQASADLGGLNPTSELRVWVINWAGTGLRPLGSIAFALAPSITDDGQFVVYASSDPSSGNVDGSTEIWKIRSDDTAKTRLTSTTPPSSCGDPEISGNGSRVAFGVSGAIGSFNSDGGPALMAMDASGSGLVLLAEGAFSRHTSPDMTLDGSRLVFDWTGDPFGTNPSRRPQLFRIQTDGTGLTQLTTLTDGDVWHPRVTDDGQRIAFVSNANPTGGNAAHNFELFTVRADGTGLAQLTPSSPSGLGAQTTPAIAGFGSYIVFQSLGNYTGGNADGSAELYRVKPDGTGMLQLTSDNDSIYKLPRVDAAGTWAVFQRSSGVYRVRTDGTGLQLIAPSPARTPDMTITTTTRIVYVSDGDPLGTNPDGSDEVFLWQASGGTTSQLTSFPAGTGVGRIRISRDGGYVSLFTDQPYRLTVATGALERVGAFDATLDGGSYRYGSFIATSQTGTKLAFSTDSDTVTGNLDGSTELFLIDLARTPAIRVSASSPTVVSWDADPHVSRYDLVRGDVANLAIAGSTVDLGVVACTAEDLARLDTALAPDPADPLPGQTFFYVFRGKEGPSAGPGSYGQGSGGLERVAGPGGCQ